MGAAASSSSGKSRLLTCTGTYGMAPHLLRAHAESGAGGGGTACVLRAAAHDAAVPCTGAQPAGDEPHCSGLAGAVVAQQGGDFATVQLQGGVGG